VRQTAPADACLPAWLAERRPGKLCLRPPRGTKSNAAHVLAACTFPRFDGVPTVSAHPRRSAGPRALASHHALQPVAAGALDHAVSWPRATAQPVRHDRSNQGVTEVLITHVREVTASIITTGIPAVAGAGVARRHAGGIVVSAVPRSRPSA
jgi:hypothetical protein